MLIGKSVYDVWSTNFQLHADVIVQEFPAKLDVAHHSILFFKKLCVKRLDFAYTLGTVLEKKWAETRRASICWLLQ